MNDFIKTLKFLFDLRAQQLDDLESDDLESYEIIMLENRVMLTTRYYIREMKRHLDILFDRQDEAI